MTRHLEIADLSAITVPEEPAISPDGARIVYVLRAADVEQDRNVRSLWALDVAGGPPAALTHGPSDSAPAWSPDGSRLAFLREVDGPPQVWVLADGGTPARLTAQPLGAGPPVWSPDGTRIAFTAPVDLLAADGEDDDARAGRERAPIVADRLDYLADGEGLRRGRRRHLHVVDVSSGSCRRLTHGDWDAGTPAWSPDGSMLAFSAAMDPDADLTRRAAAYVLALDGAAGTGPRLVGSADGWAGPLAWTDDGSALLVAGTVGPPNAHYRLLRVEVAAGTTVDVSAALDRNVMFGSPGYPGATPRPGGDGTVLFCARDRGCTHLYAVGQGGGVPAPVVAGAGRNVSGLSVARGRAAFVLATEASFGEIASVDLATGSVAVHTSHGAVSGGALPHPRAERRFHISDGTVVHGWLMRDPSAERPQPLLLDVHGGPHNAWNAAADDVHLYHHELVSRGWAVLLLNPRGSDGYGERFYTAAVGGWGVEDAKDLLEPIDALVEEGIADPRRLAVTGYSYGGYMTCFLTSRDDRFAAAVAGGPISDVTSMAGTADNRRGLSESEFGGRLWADRGRYDAMSPLARVEQVRTPTLILQGEADLRCPVGQAQQWHSALRELGVPTRLVLYPGGSHAFIIDGLPSHRLDYNRRVVDWVERHAG